MEEQLKFRVSSALKNIIGKELIKSMMNATNKMQGF
jgi:hypothetical protein